MDSKDKIIQEQKERIIALNEEIQRLQALLSEAGIPYEKKTQEKENVAVQSDLAVKDAETEQGKHIIPEPITQKHAQYFYSFFNG